MELTEALQNIVQTLQELEETILSGWPTSIWSWPTDQEALAIESVFHELSLHEPTLGDERCWFLAGQIVARVRRDRPTPALRVASTPETLQRTRDMLRPFEST